MKKFCGPPKELNWAVYRPQTASLTRLVHRNFNILGFMFDLYLKPLLFMRCEVSVEALMKFQVMWDRTQCRFVNRYIGGTFFHRLQAQRNPRKVP
jgi:hypothetical protein